MPTEVLGCEPVRPGDAVLRVGDRALDLTVRAVVVGLVEVRPTTVGSASADAAAARRDGAAVVELDGDPEALRSVLLGGAHGTPPPGAWGCRVASTAGIEAAAAAGVELLTVADAATAAQLASMRLEPFAQRWEPSVIASPSAVEVLAPEWSRHGGSLVVDASLDPLPDGGEANPLPAGPAPGWVLGITLASEEHDVVAATTLAVFGGARVVRTPWVRPARRAADLVATLSTERWEVAGPADPQHAGGGAGR